MATIIAHKQFGRPTLEDDSPNPFWNSLVQAATRGLYTVPHGPNHLKLEGLTDFGEINIATVVSLASLGMQVLHYPAFVLLPLAQKTDNVPSYLPGAYVLDANGEPTETLKTWAEWRPNAPETATHAVVGLTWAGVDAEGSVIAQLVSAGFTVLSLPEAQAIETGVEE